MTWLLLPLILASAIGLRLLRRARVPHRVSRELAKRTKLEEFVEHGHPGIVHNHRHTHVTHNKREGADELIGEWEHLTSTHSHRHNHAELVHAHAAHENVEHEHLGEAHIHDHERPDRSR